MKPKFNLSIFFFLLFSFLLWGTSFVSNSIRFDNEVPTGKNYHVPSVRVSWSVTGEDPGEQYTLSYEDNQGWHLCDIEEGNGYPPYPPGGTGGDQTYTVTWNLPNINYPNVRLRIVTKNLIILYSGYFGVYRLSPEITIRAPSGGEVWSGVQTIRWDVSNAWPDERYRIQYSYDNGLHWEDITTVDSKIATETGGVYYFSYNWNTYTALDQPGDDYLIKITGLLSQSSDVSGAFTIDNRPNINVSANITPSEPNGRINIDPIAYPQSTPDSYFGVIRHQPSQYWKPQTGWYTQYPVITITGYPTDTRDTILRTWYIVHKFEPLNVIYQNNVTGNSVTINFQSYGDGKYQVEFWFEVQRDLGGGNRIILESQHRKIPTDILTTAKGLGNKPGYSWNTNSDIDKINIDTTPPDIISIFVNKPPDGKWARLKDTGELVHWYDTDPNKVPVVYFIPEVNVRDELSGIFFDSEVQGWGTGLGWGAHKHSIDTSMPMNQDNLLRNYSFDTQSLIELNLNFEIPDIPDVPDFLQDIIKNAVRISGFYFPVYNARGKKVRVGVWDRAGNIRYYENHPLYISDRAEYIPLYVDTIPPRTRVEISTDETNALAIWPTFSKDIGIPVDQIDPDDGNNRRVYSWINNIGFFRPEDATPPSGYPLSYIEHLFYASSENSSRKPTKFRLIATDTPRYIITPFELSLWPGWEDSKYGEHYKYRPQYDPRFSDFSITNYGSGISDDFHAPRYRRSYNFSDDIRVDTEGNGPGLGKWETDWQRSNTTYLRQNVVYEDISPNPINDWVTITDWFMLPSNVTSLEYFAIDNAGNEESYPYFVDLDKDGNIDNPPKFSHHLIVDEGGGLVKRRVLEDIGKGNLRADDNVPDPDIKITPSDYNGENGWYISPVTIELTYNNPDNWKDPLPTGEPGSGIKKFQYALKNDPNPPSESDFIDYTYNKPFTLTSGQTWIYYRAIDNLGNRSGNISRPYIPYEKNPIRVDTVPPLTTINLSGENVTLTSTDVGSGVASISYRTRADLNDDTTWETVPLNSVSFILPVGKSIVEYYAKDIAGNYEPIRRSNLKETDNTPPTTFITYSGPYYNDGTNTYITSENNSNPTRFSLSATDGAGTGVRTGYPKYKKLPSTTEYTWDGNPFSLPPSSTGIEYWSVDVANNEELPHKIFPASGSLIIDDTPPIITFTRDKGPDQTGWYNLTTGAPTITITANDQILNSMFYSIDGSNPTIPATIPSFDLQLTSDGIYNIVAKADDKLGNTKQENYPFNPVKVDLTKPFSDLTFNNGIFTLTSTDSTSGVKTIYWKYILSDGTEIQNSYDGPSTTFTTPSGINRIEYWAVDNAGNEEDHKTYNISQIDDTPPVTTISYSQPYYQKQNEIYVTSNANTTSLRGKTQFSITSTDPVVNGFSSGIAPGYPRYRFNSDAPDNDPDWITYSGLFNVSPTDTSIYAYAKDGAGNEETPHKSLSFMVDDEPPTGTNLIINPSNPSSTGWYNSITGAPVLKFTGATDSGSGVKGVRYKTDGSDPDLSSPIVNIDTEFTLDDVKIDAGNFKYASVDNLENRETVKAYNQNIWVDTRPPTSTINIDFSRKKFTITATDNGLSGYSQSEYRFDNGDWQPYSEGSEISIPSGTKRIYARSYDNAGNIEDPPVYRDIPSVKITGYVKDYKGNPVSGINVVLGGDVYQLVSTKADGYYEFSNLDPLGNYYIAPLIQNSMPYLRYYNGTGGTDLQNQNFIVLNGWLNNYYDKGNSNDYYFKTNKTLPENSRLIKDFTISKGGNILTGDIEGDGKLDLIVKDSNSLSAYHYNSSYDIKFLKQTSYNLSLIDSIENDTQLEIFLTGIDGNLSEVYDKSGNRLKTISKQGVPDNTEWDIRFGQSGNILFAGKGTDYNTILLYDYSTDQTIWETTISQKIIPDNLNICVRNDGKVMVVFAGESDEEDLILYGIDLFTGQSLFSRKLNGVSGKLKIAIGDVDGDGFGDIIGVRCSTENKRFPLTVYRFSNADGRIISQYSITQNTSDTRFSISDLDGDGNRKVIVSDYSGNIYVFDILNGLLLKQKQNAGNLWACVDFDGKKDNKKEIVVSIGSYVKVLDSSLNEIMSCDLNDLEGAIKKVIVSDINNDGIIEIIATSLTKTYILRPPTTSDLPNPPTNLNAYAASDGVYLSWSYTFTGSPLSEFRIYRSIDGINWRFVSAVSSDKNWYKDVPTIEISHKDVPPNGMWYYKVSAYNDYGEVDCVNPSSVLVSFSGLPESGGGGGCFIATLCFGENGWQVKVFKEFRDRFLINNFVGEKFVEFYYRNSPKVCEFLKVHRIFVYFIRVLLYIALIFVLIFNSGFLPYIVFVLSSFALYKRFKIFK